ncbi:CAAX amino terminal protease self- immunity [Polystyrenella longa]|uniref:CAAX amino terminal protease self-immunity n=1 Tax=Polystyrenella longa TaxID=2528007 RepID=A0A518CK16_9PLAN|nr:CPBP family intramembrane glutamic endopeptidase [Polystyrenella longa]QDU79524.1 CAAX amino terminal protease self- immunity [Polystyrenella longa]
MFAVTEEAQPMEILATLLMGAVMFLGFWAWYRLSQDRLLQYKLIASLQKPKVLDQPMTGQIAFFCFLAWLGVLLVSRAYVGELLDALHLPQSSMPAEWQLPYLVIVTGCQFYAMLTVLVFAHVRGHVRLADCGFRADDLADQIKAGAYCFLLAMPLILITILITYSFRNEENAHDLIKMMKEQGTLPNILMIGFSAIFLASITEEMLFRVCVQGAFQQFRPVLAIVFTALFFALVHGFPDSLPLIPLALILGMLYYYKVSFLACVAMHSIFNAYNFGLTLLVTVGQ